jgi:serine phosphatase RsbU (regulator of sigma subunit)
VLGGSPPEQLLPTLEQVLQAERHDPTVFTTLALLQLAPDRRTLELTAAGHPSPLLLDGTAIAPLADRPGGPPIGIVERARWEPQTHTLPDGPWSLLLYTDGVIEGRCGPGSDRLGEQGLAEIVERARVTHATDPAAVVRAVVEAAEERNAGPLLDDVALVLMSRTA